MSNLSAENDSTTSLSESWATLSNSDYSRDDDLQSQHTDLGSLVDNNGSDEIHSINDHDAASEAGEAPSSTDDEAPQNPNPQPNTSSDLQDSIIHSTSTTKRSKSAAIEFKPTGQWPEEAQVNRKHSLEAAAASEMSGTIGLAQRTRHTAIEFEEPEQWPEDGQVNLKHNLEIFEAAEASEILGTTELAAKFSDLVGTLRMTMCKSGIKLDRPFQLLYMGDGKARADILEKIGHCLVAGTDSGLQQYPPESARYHVIPASFGPGSSPIYADLVPIHTQLVVDECTATFSVKKETEPDHIQINLKNGRQYMSGWVGASYKITGREPWLKPDLAIFFTCNEDNPLLWSMLQTAHTFTLRHRIPCMVICEEQSWSAQQVDNLLLDRRSLHFSVESMGTTTSEGRVLKRLPVDLQTFKTLDAGQLSKNIACLVTPASSKLQTPQIWTKSPTPLGKYRVNETPIPSEDVEKNLSNSFISRSKAYSAFNMTPAVQQVVIVGSALLGSVLAYIFCRTSVMLFVSLFTSLSIPSIRTISAPSSHIVCPSALVTTISATTPMSLPTALLSPDSTTSLMSRGLATVPTNTDLAKNLSHPLISSVNKSDNFQVTQIGDCHLIVKVPTKFMSRKKAPNMWIDVSRGQSPLNATLSKLFDGVYTLKIDREEAYGPLNVTIRISKPLIEEHHEVDFGNPWLKVTGWKKAAHGVSDQLRKDMEVALANLMIGYERLLKDLESVTGDETRRAARARLKTISKDATKLAKESRRNILRKTEEIRRIFLEHQKVISNAMLREVQVARTALKISSRVAGERQRVALQKIRLVISQGSESLQSSQEIMRTTFSELRQKLHRIPKSEKMAVAQARAQHMLKLSSNRAMKKTERTERRRKGINR